MIAEDALVMPATTGNMLWIRGGTFSMGSDRHYPEEAPVQVVAVDGLWMDPFTVTNAEFALFVAATGHVTVPERALNAADFPGVRPALLVPGSLVFHMTDGRVDLHDASNWWSYVPGACWRHPEGPGSDLVGRERHPVVQVAFEDATAYAVWAGKDLPTEAEWEYAARGGFDGAEFAWGDELTPEGRWMANTWQGPFPWRNFTSDGYAGTSPVGSFPPNGYGLFDMAGNVWQWTADWYSARHTGAAASPCCVPRNPVGATHTGSYDPALPAVRVPRKVMKGGSFLCAPNYCRRYRPAARHPQMFDTATCHIGFRCVIRQPRMTPNKIQPGEA